VADLLVDRMLDLVGAGPSASNIEARKIDVTEPASIDSLVQSAGPFDVLVYVAGWRSWTAAQPLEQVTADAIRDIVDVNFTGCFLLAKAITPGMKVRVTRSIVTISSRAGLATSLTGIQSGVAAKHAQIGLVKQLALELGPFGIIVNSVAPDFMATSPDYERQWASYSEEFRQGVCR